MNALIQQRQLLANQPIQSLWIRSVQNTYFFLNREGLPHPFYFWTSLVFLFLFFFINSTFDLGPGVIACITGVSFSLFSRLQNSLYFSVNSNTRGSQTKGLQRGWKQRARLGRDVFFLSPHTGVWGSRLRLLRRALPISLLILRKKKRLFCSLLFSGERRHSKREASQERLPLTLVSGSRHWEL